MKNVVFWNVTPCGYCKNPRFGERSASIITVTRIGELGTMLAVLTRATRRKIPDDGILHSLYIA
jgi:hypothetical protein